MNQVKPLTGGAFLFALLFSISTQAIAQEGVTVHFKVKYDQPKAVKNPGIRGSMAPLSWDKNYPVTDADGDGIYEATVTFASASTEDLQYKFVYGKGQVNWELSSGNRLLALDQSEISLPVKTWNVADAIDLESIQPLTAEELQADFQVAKEALLTAHPGLYRYNSKEEINALFEQYEAIFSKPMDHGAAYLNFSKMLAQIRCSHTYANYWGQSPLIKQAVINQANKLPFTFRIVNNRMIVMASADDRIPAGTEITHINQEPVSDIFNSMQSVLRMDGHNEAKSTAELNLTGTQDYETFDVYFPLFYPPTQAGYALAGKNLKSGEPLALTVNPLSRVARRDQINAHTKQLPSHDDELWQFEVWDGDLAYLKLGTFDDHNFSFEWSDYLADVFKKIRKSGVQDLIIDIRWNEGGQDEIIGYLAGFIAKEQPQLVARHDQIAYDLIPESLRDYMNTWSPRFYDMRSELKPEADHFTWKKQDEDKLRLLPKRFEGNVYLLTNGANSSASFFLAEAAKANALATLVGETTGGNQKGINGGMMFFVRLPHSQIEFDIPVIGMYSEEKPDAGIIPDYEVKTTVDDLVNGRDPVIEKVKALIAERKG